MRRLSDGRRLAPAARFACRRDRRGQPLHAWADDGVCLAILVHPFDEHLPRGRDFLGRARGADGPDHAADAGDEGPDLVPTGHDQLTRQLLDGDLAPASLPQHVRQHSGRPEARDVPVIRWQLERTALHIPGTAMYSAAMYTRIRVP